MRAHTGLFFAVDGRGAIGRHPCMSTLSWIFGGLGLGLAAVMALAAAAVVAIVIAMIFRGSPQERTSAAVLAIGTLLWLLYETTGR